MYLHILQCDPNNLQYESILSSFASRDLTDRFKATGIPTLIVVTQDGQLITNNGRSEVTEKGTKVFQQWLSATLSPTISSDCYDFIDR